MTILGATVVGVCVASTPVEPDPPVRKNLLLVTRLPSNDPSHYSRILYHLLDVPTLTTNTAPEDAQAAVVSFEAADLSLLRTHVTPLAYDCVRKENKFVIVSALATLNRTGHVDKVLFVCTANICRSPMAQAIFNVLAEDGGLPFRAESAGTAALEGRTIAPNALAALEEVGIYAEPHKPRRVTPLMLEESELVLAMTPQHAATLRRLGENTAGGIHTLPEYAMGVRGEGIPDPYGLTMSAYRSTLRQLYEHVERVAGRLAT